MATSIFSKVPVEIQNKSGFDMSHENIFTAPVGTLVPCLTEILMPGDVINLSIGADISLPPMATDFYGSVYARFEAFFVPHRIVDGGWKSQVVSKTPTVRNPQIYLHTSYLEAYDGPKEICGRGSLLDYIGFKVDANSVSSYTDGILISEIHPLLAYHKIWDDWYRNSFVQSACFSESGSLNYLSDGLFSDCPFSNQNDMIAGLYDGTEPEDTEITPDAWVEAILGENNFNLLSLHQRNWPKGYFTQATPSPQYGTESKLTFSVAGGSGSFSIASLRAANSLQKYLERRNLAGARYPDQILAEYGVLPSDSASDRAIYLGKVTLPVYNRSVMQTTPDSTSSTRQPFEGVGARFGSSSSSGNGQLVDNFKVTETGTFMVLFSLVPKPIYSTGIRRYLSAYNGYYNYPHPTLQGLGDQAIFASELSKTGYGGTFAYIQRYAEAKYHEDECHGLLVDGESLESFSLQRSFDSAPSFGSSFLEIPTTAMDNVSAVASTISGFGCWVDMFNNFRKVSVLAAYSIPTLGDEKDTHTQMIDKGGRQL